MDMKKGWILYDRCDYEVNQWFAAHAIECGKENDILLSVMFSDTMCDSVAQRPDFVISRQRNPVLITHLEALDIPVFNNSRVCEICNDKRKTHLALDGLPRMKTIFVENEITRTSFPFDYPMVVKPAFGHGGDRVQAVGDQNELQQALASILPQPALVQEMATDAGCDLRIYVLFREMVASVMRTANEGIVSNFKRGGSVALHRLTDAERSLAQAVIDRFASIGAPLAFAGIDLIYHNGQPRINEVEDVVGSRMLYKVSDLDCVAMYIQTIAEKLSHDKFADL